MEYYFKRDVWDDLLKWKEKSKESLEVNGARQVGKTFILKKFCEENFKQFFYINMGDSTGKDFLESIKVWFEKFSHEHDRDDDMLRLMKTYKPGFEDSENTVILIDEIQESSRVYNLIRPITRTLKARLIVIGSYLGKALDKDFFLPAGDLKPLTIYPLSFPEFLDVFGERKRQELFQPDDKLVTYFELYKLTGGYPAVVAEYLNTQDLEACTGRLLYIINLFTSESTRYFKDIEDVDVYTDLFKDIALLAVKEKHGTDLIEELSVLMKDTKTRPSKVVIKRTVAWLRKAGVIDYASKIVDADVTSEIPRSRIYFNDLGMAGYFAGLSGIDNGSIEGFLAENYVFLVLKNKFYKILGSFFVGRLTPSFSVYTKTGGELDFILCGRNGGKKIGIEVKASRGKANTGKVMPKDGKIDQMYVLKRKTCGGKHEKVVTIPLMMRLVCSGVVMIVLCTLNW